MSAWETYRDIIDLPYPTRSRHPRMPIGDRAAQFAPFAALTGFGAVLRETERITEKRIELDEYEKEKLDEKIRLILEEKEIHPEITVTFFVPDEKKGWRCICDSLGAYKKSGRGGACADPGRGRQDPDGRYL